MFFEKQALVETKQRERRLRLLVKRINQERKRQAKKTDILCNDLIAAQREFIKRLEVINFTSCFYASIVGTGDLNTLLNAAGRFIEEETDDIHVAFFLRQRDTFEVHMIDTAGPVSLHCQDLQSCFTSELVDNICKSNRICTLEDMFAMGLQGNLMRLKEISAATIPLEQGGASEGFMLVYRSSARRLTANELNRLAATSSGLSRAIACCRVPLHCTKQEF